MKVGEPNICLIFLILCSSETQVIPAIGEGSENVPKHISHEVSSKRIKLSLFYLYGFYFVTREVT